LVHLLSRRGISQWSNQSIWHGHSIREWIPLDFLSKWVMKQPSSTRLSQLWG
jgi:hypothetical protein